MVLKEIELIANLLSSKFLNLFTSFDLPLFQVFEHIIGLGSFDSPKGN